jgi:alanine racemase
MEWKAKVSFVKEIEAGTAISYGGTFVANHKMKVATIPVGYADGMKRDLSNKGHVIINGKRVPILGRICMDQFMVDVTGMDVLPGTNVTIMGKDGGEMLSVEEVSEAAHSFSYEFVCGITNRVPRKYINE